MDETAGCPLADEGSSDGPDGIGSLLVAWQSTGCPRALEALVAATLSTLKARAGRTLLRQGIADRSSVDDAISLVLDHLRRLPRTAAREAAVAPFDADRAGRRAAANHAAGMAYLLWLTRERALDVARARRRHDRRAVPLSIAAIDPARMQRPARPDHDPDHDVDRLHAVVPVLEPRLRTVVEQLLEGTTQAEIARLLGVCEGTVSRLRGRAIAALRRLMQE